MHERCATCCCEKHKCQIEIGQQPPPNPAPLQDLPGEKDCRSYLREKITSRDLKVVPTPSYFAITFQTRSLIVEQPESYLKKVNRKEPALPSSFCSIFRKSTCRRCECGTCRIACRQQLHQEQKAILCRGKEVCRCSVQCF